MFENKLPTNYCKQSIKLSREWFVFGRNVSAYRCSWVIIDRWGGEIGCGWRKKHKCENSLRKYAEGWMRKSSLSRTCDSIFAQWKIHSFFRFFNVNSKKKWVCVYFDDTSGAQRMCNEWSKPSRWRLMSKSMSRKSSFASARHLSSSSPFFPTLTHFSLSARLSLKKTHTRDNRKRKKVEKSFKLSDQEETRSSFDCVFTFWLSFLSEKKRVAPSL